MFMTKNTLTTALIVPALSLSILTVQPAAMNSGAYAQDRETISSFQSGPRQQRPSRHLSGGESGGYTITKDKRPPCPPGTAPTPNCRPWTPPRVQVSSEAECECKRRRVNGRYVKDCYVLVRQLVHYCRNNKLFRAN